MRTRKTKSMKGTKKSAKGQRMAEETQASSTSSGKKTEPLATEKPVPSVPVKKTSQYVITVDNTTGLAVKIEKLDEDTGERTELTKSEYAQAQSGASLAAAPFYAGYGGSAPAVSPMESSALIQAYYRGIADYLNALTSLSGRGH